MRKFKLIIFCCLAVTYVHAQLKPPVYPMVGKPCPPFSLNNIKYYSKTQATNATFKGKWVMLDIWARSCSSCIASLPGLNRLRKRLAGKMEIIMVAVPAINYQQDEKRITDALYTKLVSNDTLSLPYTFNTQLGINWDIAQVPFKVIIDPKGIVRAVTTSAHFEMLDSLTHGYAPKFDHASRGHEDIYSEVRTAIGDVVFTGKTESEVYKGPRFAIVNDNDFPIKFNSDIIMAWDSIGPHQVGIFHEGDYRPNMQVYNVEYEMNNRYHHGKVNAFRYAPKKPAQPVPQGDWVIHVRCGKNWKVTAQKIEY